MELYSLTDKSKYEVNIPQGSGEFYSTCPVCSQKRKPQNQKQKCFSWNRNLNLGHCHHCNASFVEFHELGKQEPISSEPQKEQDIPKQAKEKTILKISTIPSGYIDQSFGIGSNLGMFLEKHFKKEAIEKMMIKYFLGNTKEKEVIYWYMDKHLRLRTGKIMQYDSLSGKRVKGKGMMSKPDADWVHNRLNKRNKLPKDFSFSRCLFGEHLLRLNTKATVCLVESEKTALIGSIYMPNEIWLATGGKNMFNETVCRCLKGRNVIIFPDLGATKEWQEKAEEISKAVGCDMKINDVLERLATKEQREKGLDIADFYLEANNKQTIDQ